MSANTIARRVAAGLCIQCGETKENPEMIRCSACRAYQKKYNKGGARVVVERDLPEPEGPRLFCRCGLTLSTPMEVAQKSCASCVPSIRHFAEARR